MTIQEIFASCSPGILYTHHEHSDIKFERTSCGALIYYNNAGMIHNPHGASIIFFKGSTVTQRYFYLNGRDITPTVSALLEQDAITYDRSTNIWDDESIVTVSLSEN
ncbi:hypothetical protein NVP2275O_072 [Vibrio phage 2.275.O._10N.286.54.E11]|nr:hypothetical protein NVP2275O_072 [Vibrio phage 2.275.O._10N.286.54.E11]